MDKPLDTSHIELGSPRLPEDEISRSPLEKNQEVVGTVKLLINNKETVLLPTPSPDPKGS